ncbi:MAG: glycosyltransferase [Methanotrichaceae archaeon]|nr:glycosyltransferase [Methanotrichaceae archaeon]
MPIKVLDIDLAEGVNKNDKLESYSKALVLWRWRGRPLGQSLVSIFNGKLDDLELLYLASRDTSIRLAKIALKEYLAIPNDSEFIPSRILTYTVIICTHDRTSYLKKCLDSICSDVDRSIEVIVVDNAPSDDQTAKLVSEYPVRYVREDRKGLNWARSRGALESRSEIVVYTDDDVIVDLNWINGILQPFFDPEIAAVTGLVMPLELETPAQEQFDSVYRNWRQFERREISAASISAALAYNVGSGANMAFRRQIVNKLSLFDSEMDCGTSTYAAGDLYAFYRLLSLGYRIIYNPNAIVWHQYKKDWNDMLKQLYGYNVGAYSFYIRCIFQHKDILAIYAILQTLKWQIDLAISSLSRSPGGVPLDLNVAMLKGTMRAPIAYLLSRRAEKIKLKMKSQAGSQ